MVELAQGLKSGTREIVQKVLCDNPYFAHPENVVIALLADHNEELRRKGVLYILKSREEFDEDSHPRHSSNPRLTSMQSPMTSSLIGSKCTSAVNRATTYNKDVQGIGRANSTSRLPLSHSICGENCSVPVVTESCLQKVEY